MALPRPWRLRRRKEFQEVYRKGQRYAHPLAIVYVLRRENSSLRLGVSLSRKLGKAVVRNRVRRRFQEAFRELHPELRGGADIVLIPLSKAIQAPWRTLKETLRQLLRRAGLWAPNSTAFGPSPHEGDRENFPPSGPLPGGPSS